MAGLILEKLGPQPPRWAHDLRNTLVGSPKLPHLQLQFIKEGRSGGIRDEGPDPPSLSAPFTLPCLMSFYLVDVHNAIISAFFSPLTITPRLFPLEIYPWTASPELSETVLESFLLALVVNSVLEQVNIQPITKL